MQYDQNSFLAGLALGRVLWRPPAANPIPPMPPIPPEPPVSQYERPTEAMYLDGTVYTLTINSNNKRHIPDDKFSYGFCAKILIRDNF